MSYEVKTIKVSAAQQGGPVTFTFSNPVKHYIMGVTGFYFEYAGADHDIKDLFVHLSQPSQNGNTLTIKPLFGVDDNSKHTMDANSYIYVTVMAMTSIDDASVAMDNLSGIPNGQNSASQQPPSAIVNDTAFLQGFGLTFGGTDQRVYQATAGASVNQITSQQIAVLSEASIVQKAGGANDSSNSVDASLLMNCNPAQTFVYQQQRAQTTLTQSFNVGKYNWAMFVQRFTVRYPHGQKHHIKWMRLDTGYQPLSSGQVNWHAKVSWADNSGNNSVDWTPNGATPDGSCVDALFIGWP